MTPKAVQALAVDLREIAQEHKEKVAQLTALSETNAKKDLAIEILDLLESRGENTAGPLKEKVAMLLESSRAELEHTRDVLASRPPHGILTQLGERSQTGTNSRDTAISTLMSL